MILVAPYELLKCLGSFLIAAYSCLVAAYSCLVAAYSCLRLPNVEIELARAAHPSLA